MKESEDDFVAVKVPYGLTKTHYGDSFVVEVDYDKHEDRLVKSTVIVYDANGYCRVILNG